MEKKFKNKIAVKGSKTLLRAFSEELNEMGYKLIGKDIDNYEGYSGPCDPKYITTNGKHLVCKNGEYTFAMNEGSENSWLTLPEDYTKAIQLASEVEEEIPEYVKCIKSHKNQFTKGKIYETRDYFGSVKKDDAGDSNGINPEGNFIPATKAEYDAQELEFKKKELLEEAKRRFPVGCKFKCLVTGNTYEIDSNVTFSFGKNVDNNIYSWRNGGIFHHHYDYKKELWAEVIKDDNIEIAGYKAEIKDNKIAFGCKKFSKEDLQAIKKVNELSNSLGIDFNFDGSSNTLIVYEGDDWEVSTETLDKLINKL